MAPELDDEDLAADELTSPAVNRRKHPRLTAEWHVFIWGKSRQHAVQAQTINVNTGGFYCRCPRGFSLGDKLAALLEIPSVMPNRQGSVLVLQCDVYVVRVESLADGHNCEIAFQILDYSILRAEGGPLQQSWPDF